MRRATWLAAGAAAVVFSTLYVLFKATRAASARLVADATTVLEFLAWRSECLCHYNPPEEQPPPRAGNDDALPIQVDAMVVHGNSMAAVPLGAADLYCDLLVRAGCKTVLLTGGVGRETPPLWTELADRGLTAPFADAPWPRDTPPSHVRLPCQNVTKPVLQGVDLTIAPDDLRQYASEADVFLELFVARCRERGVHVAFGGNPMADQPASAAPPPSTQPGPATPRVFLETASTHTGTNVEFSRASLALSLATAAILRPNATEAAARRRGCRGAAAAAAAAAVPATAAMVAMGRADQAAEGTEGGSGAAPPSRPARPASIAACSSFRVVTAGAVYCPAQIDQIDPNPDISGGSFP